MNITWRVQPEPTGRYRSLEKRGWPQAFDDGGRLMAQLTCEEDYVPRRVREGDHKPLTAHVFDHSQGMQRRKMWKLKGEFGDLGAAKIAVQRCLAEHPHFFMAEPLTEEQAEEKRKRILRHAVVALTDHFGVPIGADFVRNVVRNTGGGPS